jgi:hypothetical protein
VKLCVMKKKIPRNNALLLFWAINAGVCICG